MDYEYWNLIENKVLLKINNIIVFDLFYIIRAFGMSKYGI